MCFVRCCEIGKEGKRCTNMVEVALPEHLADSTPQRCSSCKERLHIPSRTLDVRRRDAEQPNVRAVIFAVVTGRASCTKWG